MIITSGDAVYKMDYNKVLEYHIAKKADITVVCKELAPDEDATRFGTVKMNEPAGSKNLRKTGSCKITDCFNRDLCDSQKTADRSGRAVCRRGTA